MVNTFEGLLALLVDRQIRFVLVGGLAVSLNGFVRTTEDMDVLVDDNSANIALLLECLLLFGEGHAEELTSEEFTDEEGAIRVREDFDLDIFVRMRGNRYRELAGFILHHTMRDGTRIPYLSRDGLILLKESSSREKDQIDVAALKRLSREAAQSGDQIHSLDALRESMDPPEAL